MLSDFPIFFDQKRDTTLKSIEIALAIILSPDKETALIAKRLDNAHLAGFWEFPGGKIETGESSEEAAVREAFEETGLKVTPIKKLTPVSYDYEDRRIHLNSHLCVSDSLNAKALASSEIKWVSLAELSNIGFPEVNFRIISELLAEEF